jgi:hypothetical protein
MMVKGNCGRCGRTSTVYRINCTNTGTTCYDPIMFEKLWKYDYPIHNGWICARCVDNPPKPVDWLYIFSLSWVADAIEAIADMMPWSQDSRG